MKIYKLYNTYPGSPIIGTTINSGNSMYYTFKPQNYPHLWKEMESDETYISEDGVLLHVGDVCYIIQDNEKITPDTLTEYGIQCLLENKTNVFSNKEIAYIFLINSINLKLMDGDVIGKDIPLYGICLGSFQRTVISSLKMYQKIKKQKTTGHISDKWKWFKDEKNMNEYIIWNKPKYSLTDINKIFNVDLEKIKAFLV